MSNGIFDLKAALHPLNGKAKAFDDLWNYMETVRRTNLGDLSPEIKTEDLFRIAMGQGYITEDDNNYFHVTA